MTRHVMSPTCDKCGRRLAGVICVIDPEPTLACPQCAPSDPVPGVYVREAFDPDEKRWQPGVGEVNRLADGGEINDRRGYSGP